MPGAHTINLPGGLYLLTKGELDVRANVTINGPRPQRGLSLAARIDGNNQSRVFDVANGFSVHINRVTIRHGRACRGAGIRNDGALTITSSVIRDNALDGIECDGGGIRNTANGTLTIHSSTIRGNTGSNHAFGGGVSNDGSAAIFDSTIRDNHVSGVEFGANGGGGIKSTGELTLSNSTVRGNSSTLKGGGLWLTGGVSSISTSTITFNWTTDTEFFSVTAGGIYNQGRLDIARSTISNNLGRAVGGIFHGSLNTIDARLTVENTTISGNGATGDFSGVAGAILLVESPQPLGMASIVNSTISHNTIPVIASGAGGLASGFEIELRNTIVAQNSFPNCDNFAEVSLGHNLSSDVTCTFTAAGDMVGTDPQLGPLADNGGPTQTRRLNFGSPAIDAGDVVGCPAMDQRGVTRPQGAACDIGAYEFVPFISGRATE